MFFDRFTGKRLKLVELPDEIISGRYQVEQSPIKYQRRYELATGELLINEGNGRWCCEQSSGLYTQPTGCTVDNDDNTALNTLLSDTIKDVASKFNDHGPSNFERISPLLPPTVLGRSEMQPLETLLLDIIKTGHLYEIAYHPKIELIQKEELVLTGRAKRLSSKAPDYLSAHSEDWQSRTFTGILPKRIITRLNEDNYNIYENRVFARLIDHLDIYLVNRLGEIGQLADIFDAAVTYSLGGNLYWRISENICSMWGQSFSNEELNHAASKSKITIENLRFLLREIRSLRQSKLYKAIPQNVHIGSQLKLTNVLAHDQHYRHLLRLWNAWLKVQECAEQDPWEKICIAQQRAHLYADYVQLLVYHALNAIKLNPNEPNTKLVVKRDGFDTTIKTKLGRFRITPVFTDLDGINLPAESHINIDEYRLIVSPYNPLKVGAIKPNEFVCPTFQYAGESITASPLELFSIENLAMALQRWHLKKLASGYGQKIEANKSIVSNLSIHNSKVENGGIKILAPLQSSWKNEFDQSIRTLTRNTGIRLTDDDVILVKNNIFSANENLRCLSQCQECGTLNVNFSARENDCFEVRCDCNATWGIYRQKDGSRIFKRTPSSESTENVYFGRYKDEFVI